MEFPKLLSASGLLKKCLMKISRFGFFCLLKKVNKATRFCDYNVSFAYSVKI